MLSDFDQPLRKIQFARRPRAFDRRTKPQRKQNRGIGGQPYRFALARKNLIVKGRKIEALDEAPYEARAMVRRQEALKIDHIPARCRRSGRTTRVSPIADSPAPQR